MQRDSIDFEKESISKLFLKMFLPTLFGMIFSSTINIADGIFVGKGVGSIGLASVNITAPLFMFATGIALMFGCGGAIVVAIHMAHGNRKAANINMTQAFTVSLLIIVLISIGLMIWSEGVGRVLGGTEVMMPYVKRYMMLVVPALPCAVVLLVGMFFIRLDGNPTYSMMCEVIPAGLNVVLDWLFVFPLRWGIGGAAIASSVSQFLGSLMVVYYMVWKSKSLKFYMPKFTKRAMLLTGRNVGYMARNGVTSLIGEFAISCVILVGNLSFVKRLGEEGVAAYSVASYCLPIIFMIGNAIAQSGQPILSYNFGKGAKGRIAETFRLEIRYAIVGGLLLTLLGVIFSKPLALLFLDRGSEAYNLAVAGLPWFASGFLFITLNLMFIGYIQSLERTGWSCMYMLLRGFVVVVPMYVLMPNVIGTVGLWLSIPIAELLTTVVIVSTLGKASREKKV